MLNKIFFARLALVALGSFAVAASAATDTASFQVKIKIEKSCSVTAGADSNIDFGTHGASATGLQGSSNISVTCSKTTPYFIGLTPSNANTSGAGIMTSLVITPADTVAYQLRSATGMTGAIWGNTATSTAIGNGVTGTGNGSAQVVPVFATVPSANSTPADYIDTVTVSVNY